MILPAQDSALSYAGPTPVADIPPGRLPVRPFRWMLVCVILYTATLLLPTLGGRRVLTQHEVFAAEPAREMLHGGNLINWIIPHFAGVPREVKPPTTGWIIAGSMALFHSEAEWVVRLPSALAATFLAALVAAFTARWLGTAAGLLAGLMNATVGYSLVQGRLAEADIFMITAVCLAMYAFAIGNISGPTTPIRSRWLPLLFYLGAGASFLIKGVGPIFIFPACILYLLVEWWRSGDRRAIWFLLNPLGLALFIIMLSSWPLAAWRVDPGIVNVWHRETIGRAAGEFIDRQPWYFYAIAVPEYLLPWLPFAAVGLVAGLQQNWLARPFSRFLLCWFSVGIFILSLSAFKHHHYAFPMLPPAMIVAAGGMLLWFRSSRPESVSDHAIPITGTWIAITSIATMWVLLRVRVEDAKYEIAAAAGLLAVGGAIALYTIQTARPRAAACAVFATAWAISVCLGLLIYPRFDDYRWSAELGRRVSNAVPTGQPIWLVKLGEHHIAYYLRQPVQRVDREADISGWLADGASGDRYAICARYTADNLGRMANTDVIELDRVEKLRRNEKTEGDRPVLVRIHHREQPK